MRILGNLLFWLFNIVGAGFLALGIYLFFTLPPVAQEWNPTPGQALVLGIVLCGVCVMDGVAFRSAFALPANATGRDVAARYWFLACCLTLTWVLIDILAI